MDVLLIINIIITILFSLFCLFYILLVLYYIITNILSRRPKIVSYWLDYFLFIVLLFTSSILYIYYQITSSTHTQLPQCLNDTSCFILTHFIFLNAFLSLNNLLFDIIQCIMACVSIAYTLQIKADDIKTLNLEIGKHSIMKTSDKKRHLTELLIFILFYAIIAYLLNGVFKDDSSTGLIKLNVIIILYASCEVILIVLTFSSIYALSKFKGKIIEKNYNSKNRKLRSIYQIHASRMAYFNDFITFKSIIDLVGNIPIIILSSTGRLVLSSLWISYILFSAYIFFNGSIFAYIDRKNKVKAKKVLFGFFKLDCINFSFGHMEKAKLYDDNFLDLKCDDAVLINELNLPLIESNKLFDDLEISLNNILNDYLQVNFYLIIKLMYQYYKTNELTYNEIAQSHIEKLRSVTLTSSSSSTSMDTSNRLLSKVTATFINKFKQSLTFSEFTLLSPIDNKRYYDEFNSNFKPTPQSKVEFTITLLESDTLLQLFPYYNINIEDILISLDVAFNNKSIQTWFDSKSGDKIFNYYSTHDSLLSFEVYDSEVFSEEKLSVFSYKYSNYLVERIHSRKKSFIPFVLGIFAITYSDYKKYVVLYRNPCFFSQLLFYNSIALVTYSEREEQMGIQSNNNNNLGNDEIEKQRIEINMKGCEDEMLKEINNTLTSDLQFIKEMKFVCFPKLNVVITNETTTSDANDVSSISELINTESFNFASIKSTSAMTKRNDYDVFIKGINHKLAMYKMENGTHVLTSVDLINLVYGNGQKIVFKIFFSELFRMSIDLKFRDNFKNEIINNRFYCKLIKGQILKLFNKAISEQESKDDCKEQN